MAIQISASVPNPDNRSPKRRIQDEQIASEPLLPPPDLEAREIAHPIEAHLRQPHSMALAGVVENGVVRILDPSVTLPERARVIVVAAETN